MFVEHSRMVRHVIEHCSEHSGILRKGISPWSTSCICLSRHPIYIGRQSTPFVVCGRMHQPMSHGRKTYTGVVPYLVSVLHTPSAVHAFIFIARGV